MVRKILFYKNQEKRPVERRGVVSVCTGEGCEVQAPTVRAPAHEIVVVSLMTVRVKKGHSDHQERCLIREAVKDWISSDQTNQMLKKAHFSNVEAENVVSPDPQTFLGFHQH